MIKSRVCALLGGVAWISAPASPALAQSASAADAASSGDIIVTAQRRAERVQDVPIAITALTSRQLEAARIEDGKDLQFNAPNVTLAANRNITIRGVGSASFGGTGDTNIGVLVNAILPGFIETEMSLNTPQAFQDGCRRRAASGEIGKLEDMEGIAVFLAAPESRFLTGQCLVLDGGHTIFPPMRRHA